jgi:hypothetical protein
MTAAIDLLDERLNALANPEDDSDWEAIRSGRVSRFRSARRGRLIVFAVLVLALLAGPAYAIGRAVEGWVGGEPAPPSIVRNFGSYTPQLGFNPEPGKAVRVASDGSAALYATPNAQGSYCVATDTPDGGICIQPKAAAEPLIAGIMPNKTLLVAGRVRDPRAVEIAFTDPDGLRVTRRLEVGRFFLAALGTTALPGADRPYPCKNGTWRSTFRALDSNGHELVSAQITLASVPPGRGVLCGWANGPHS